MRYMMLAALLLFACDGYPPDNGMKIADGVEITPLISPIYIECSIPDCTEVDAAVRWWNRQVDFDLFATTANGTPSVPVTEEEIPVDARFLIDPDPDEYWMEYITGVTESRIYGGVVLSARIKLQLGEWDQYTLRHELGHVAGLADDRYSIDLNSIMATPHFAWSVVTDHDRELLEYAHGQMQ